MKTLKDITLSVVCAFLLFLGILDFVMCATGIWPPAVLPFGMVFFLIGIRGICEVWL